MNTEIVAKWMEFSVLVESWLRVAAASSPIGELKPARAVGVIKQFSGADGVRGWDGARNMTTPLQPHTMRDVDDIPELMPYGHASMASEIRRGDPQWSIDVKSGLPKRRVEFSWEKWRFAFNESCWAGGAFFLPSNPMRTNPGTSFFQLHCYPHPEVMWNLHVANGRLKSDHRHFDFGFDERIDDYLDRWCRMVINFRASTDDSGFIKMWIDDKLLMEYGGPTRKFVGEGPFFKHGGYGWAGDVPALVYHDRLRIADRTGSYASVDPAAW